MSASCSSFARPAHTETIPRSQDLYAHLFQQLTRELEPVGVAEQLAIADMVRHAARLEHFSTAADSSHKLAAQTTAEFLAPGGPGGSDIDNLVLDAAIHSLNQRQMVVHSRAFRDSLRLFLKLQARRPAYEQRAVGECFANENDCVEYLASHQHRNFACASCGGLEAYFIRVRRCLECTGCHAQLGLRSGTVMANSSLPLRIWFLAIALILQDPTVTAVRAQAILRLQRPGTTRLVLRKIHDALLNDHRSRLLAGLDQYLAEPEPGVLYLKHVSSQSAAGRASAVPQYLFPDPPVRAMNSQLAPQKNLSHVSCFLFPCKTRKESRMSSEPLNLPGPEPEPARNADTQPEAQAKTKGKNSQRCLSAAECLAQLSRLSFFVLSGLITTAQSQAARGILHDILAYHQRAGGSQAGPAVDQRFLNHLRKNPDLANLFAPSLGSEQAAEFLREATNEDEQT
jgi:hypothetical protein